jgi:uncharacterized membrane protein YkvA (DUF1232 family)
MFFNKFFDSLKIKITSLKLGAMILWFACKNAKTPITAKIFCFLIVAYALSPIDLIPDFIPFLGYMDDLILLPILIYSALKLLPENVYLESKTLAEGWLDNYKSTPKSMVGLVIVLSIWIAIGLSFYFVIDYLNRRWS